MAIMKGYLFEDVMMIPVDGKQTKWLRGDIAVVGDKIVEIGEKLKKNYSDLQVLSGKNRLVMPGLVNCHTHSAMNLLRGYADDLPLMEWLETKIWPKEAFLEAEDAYWGSMLAVLEMIKGGTTTFADMYVFMEETARAVEVSGIRAVLSRGLMDNNPDHGAIGFKENLELIKNWNGKADGRITTMFGPHAPYTNSLDYLKQVMSAADEANVGIHIHLAETQAEVDIISKQYKKRPIELMESIGLFEGRHVLAAHCVKLSDNEKEILVSRKVGIAHNPQSNMKLASGVAPIPELLAMGAVVGLGTDGASSNNDYDMFEEIRTCAIVHKLNETDPTVLPAYQAIEMATKLGAEAVGLKDTGTIQAGKKADLILLDLDKPHLTPLYEPVSHAVYAAHASDVDTVMVNGQLLMIGRRMTTLDEERIIYEAQRVGENLIKRQ